MAATLSLRSGLVLAVALLLCHSLHTADAFSFLNKFRVHLINGLTNSTLDAVCKSEKGHDLGQQHIAVRQDFTWKLGYDLFGKKKYYCDLGWTKGHKGMFVYKASDDWRKPYCAFDFCRWLFRDDGIYSYDDKHKEYKFQFKWDP